MNARPENSILQLLLRKTGSTTVKRGSSEIEDGDRHLEATAAKITELCERVSALVIEGEAELNQIYASKHISKLQNRLKQSVRRLVSIQNEVQSIQDNIDMLNLQIEAVDRNIDQTQMRKFVGKYKNDAKRSKNSRLQRELQNIAASDADDSNSDRQSNIQVYGPQPRPIPKVKSMCTDRTSTYLSASSHGSQNDGPVLYLTPLSTINHNQNQTSQTSTVSSWITESQSIPNQSSSIIHLKGHDPSNIHPRHRRELTRRNFSGRSCRPK